MAYGALAEERSQHLCTEGGQIEPAESGTAVQLTCAGSSHAHACLYMKDLLVSKGDVMAQMLCK